MATEQQIRDRAQPLWEKAGRPDEQPPRGGLKRLSFEPVGEAWRWRRLPWSLGRPLGAASALGLASVIWLTLAVGLFSFR